MSEDQDLEKFFDDKQSDFETIYLQAMNGEENTLDQETIQDPNRYGEASLINSGGLKLIKSVEDKSTRRQVAFAQLKDPSSATARDKFIREAHLTASLEHPNIMPVYDTGIDSSGHPYFTMKLLLGGSLQKKIKNHYNDWESWPLLQRLNIFRQICEGMDYAHSQHILHLDLKPENIQMGDFGEVIICDWGLGKILFEEEDEVENEINPDLENELTIDGLIRGTPGFMAPEQIDKALGSREIRTDTYALGGVLFAMLYGQAPHVGDDLSSTLESTLKEGRKVATSKLVPNALTAVLEKSLDFQADLRYQSVLEFKNDIDAYLKGFATQAEEANLITKAALFVKRHKALLISIILLFGVVLLSQLYSNEKATSQKIRTQTIPRLLTLSNDTLNEFKFSQTEDLVNAVLALKPDHPSVWKARGELLFYQQRFRESIKAFEHSSSSMNQALYQFAQELNQVKNKQILLTPTQLLSFFQKTKLHRDTRIRLIKFAQQNVSDIAGYLEIVKYFHELIDPSDSIMKFKYSSDKGGNSLDLSGNESFAITKIDLIEGLEIHKLNLSNLPMNHYDTRHLISMPLIELNLTSPRPYWLEFTQDMPQLKRLILNKSIYSAEKLNLLSPSVELIDSGE
jgi:serine/threonine protein kinase